MKKLFTLFLGMTFISWFGLQAQTVDPATAWWDNEDFESENEALLYKDWSLSGGANQVLFGTLASPSSTADASGKYFSGTCSNSGGRWWSKDFSAKSLSGIVYLKTAFFHHTYGNGYYLRDSNDQEIFYFRGVNPGGGTSPAVEFTGLDKGTVGLGMRGQWSEFECILDLANNKIIKLTAKNSSQTKKSYTTTDVSLSGSHNGTISKFYIEGVKGADQFGLDNTTIGALIPTKIKNLSGDESFQTIGETQVDKAYSVTGFAEAMELELNLTVGTMQDILWSISDWGGLSVEDQALVSLNRNTEDYSQATLSTSDMISDDATITIKAELGEISLTKEVTLKAESIEGIKMLLDDEIDNAGEVLDAVTDNNGFLTTIKSTLSNAVAHAQGVYDDDEATVNDVNNEISTLQGAISTFNTQYKDYSDFVDYIASVQSVHNAEVRTAAFFTAIKSTLQSAINTATDARTTVASGDDIENETTTLENALGAFNNAIPHYNGLENLIATVQSRYSAVNARSGTKFLNYKSDKVEELGNALDDASLALSTETTTGSLDNAKTTLQNELETFDGGDAQVSPSVLPVAYQIYTYGVDAGESKTTKKILFADGDVLRYKNVGDLSGEEAAVWQIMKISATEYTIQNFTSKKYLNNNGNGNDNPVELSDTPVNFTMPEAKAQDNSIQIDEGYFLYAIVNSNKALEVDLLNAETSTGVLTQKNGYADRTRFAFQFEEFDTTAVGTDNPQAAKEVLRVEYLDLTGKLVPQNTHGFLIQKTIYVDGSSATQKVIRIHP